MRVLIAGASGILGRHMAWEIIAAGHEVIALGRRSDPGERLRAMGAEYLRADLMDREGLLRAVRGVSVDAVVHAATALSKAPMRHQGMAATNALRTQGTANLVRAAQQMGATRIVSESMHFGYGYGDWGDHFISEDNTPFAPRGRTRPLEGHLAGFRAKEQQTFGTEGLDGISLRFGALYGPGFGSGGTDQIVELLRKRKLPVVKHGGVLHWTDLRDAGDATVAALERGVPGEAYNIVDDEPVSLADHIRYAAEAFGTPKPMTVPLWLLSTVAPYVHTLMKTSMRVSNTKAKRELNWQPSTPSSREGLRNLA